eukprot:1194675-Prorocentrum_minimum.AAC.7
MRKTVGLTSAVDSIVPGTLPSAPSWQRHMMPEACVRLHRALFHRALCSNSCHLLGREVVVALELLLHALHRLVNRLRSRPE